MIIADIIFMHLRNIVGIKEHLIRFVERFLIFKVLLLLLLFGGGKPLTERNISVVEFIVLLAEIILQNNVPNFSEVVQLEDLSCFLGF